MKKKRNVMSNIQLGSNEILLKMKLLTLLMFAAFVSASASSYSQSTKFNLNLKAVTIGDVFQKIEEKSEFVIIYNEKTIDINRKVDIEVNDEPVERILDQIFNGDKDAFRIMDRQIAIYPNEKKDSPSQIKAESNSGQQKREISGSVKDIKGLPLAGVSVIVKGTTTGTITNNDGKFTLTLPADANMLQFSFIGLKSSQVTIAGSKVFDIIMMEDATQIEETVVVAYGTQKKRDVIGSVSRIGSEKIDKTSGSSFEQSLQGVASGVQVSTQGGVPGGPVQVKIRGVASINSATTPLWIIDGVPIVNSGDMNLGTNTVDGEVAQSSLSLLNPNDIESIEVLKDAAATAIYGSRASNGVIMVTTKSGKKGKSTLNIDYKTGISHWTNTNIGRANTQQYFDIMDIAANTPQGLKRNFDPQLDIVNGSFPTWTTPITREQALKNNSDWINAVSQKGSFHDINISSTKGMDKSNVFLSLNYRKDEGNIKFSSMDKLSVRINVDLNPIENLKIGLKTSALYTSNNRLKSGGGKAGGGVMGGVGGWAQANSMSLPWVPVYEPTDPSGYWNPSCGANALAEMDPRYAKSNLSTIRTLGNLYAEYAIPYVPGLSFRTEAGYDLMEDKSLSYRSKVIRNEGNDASSESKNTTINYLYNVQARYNQTFGTLNLSGVAGKEWQKSWVHYMGIGAVGLTSPFQEVGTVDKTNLSFANSGIGNEFYYMAYFGRLEMKLKDKYLLGGSVRRDGASQFSPANRWGVFKALSAGWIISEEKFMKNDVVNLLKLRGSFGQTGNQYIPANISKTSYTVTTINNVYQGFAATALTTIGNPNVTWETTNSSDIGIDFGIFQNRINGSLALFNKSVNNMLLATQLPYSAGIPTITLSNGQVTGANQMYQNIGNMRSYGAEFNVEAKIIDQKELSWSLSGNITLNKNEVTELLPYLDNKGIGLLSTGGSTITKKGEELGTYYMPLDAGVDPQKGIPMIYEIDQTEYSKSGRTVLTGKIIPATGTNVSKNLYVHSGKSGIPTYYGGFQNTFRYHNFDLSLYLTYSGGNYIYNALRQQMESAQFGIGNLKKDLIARSWQKPGDIAELPQIVWFGLYYYDNNGIASTKTTGMGVAADRYLEKGDYIRMKNITLGYDVPGNYLSKIGIGGLRIYASVTNLFTITGYKGFDPEISATSNISGLVDSGGANTMPQTKTWSMGISLKF